MKQCPRCKEVYSEQLQFCLNDGSTLTGSGQSMDELETLVRSNPIVVDFAEANRIGGSESSPRSRRHTSEHYKDRTGPASKRGYGLLLAGIGIGGALVLATVFSMSSLMPKPAAVPENDSINKVSIQNSSLESLKPANTNGTATNYNSVPTSAAEPREETKTQNQNAANGRETFESTQRSKEALLRKNYNGRVIMMNAIVRAAPAMSAPEVNIVTFNEPIKIGKSAGGNNPWFRVTTASGQTGWMHGNTIEFVR